MLSRGGGRRRATAGAAPAAVWVCGVAPAAAGFCPCVQEKREGVIAARATKDSRVAERRMKWLSIGLKVYQHESQDIRNRVMPPESTANEDCTGECSLPARDRKSVV